MRMLLGIRYYALELLNRGYNLRFLRLLRRNYRLLFPKWINNDTFPLYSCFISVFLFWLYYEIFCVSPVCAYYTGPDLPSLLNKFKSVGKTYKPTLYLFSSKLQWVFLLVYCRLELLYKLFLYKNCLQSSLSFYKLIYNFFTFLVKFFLNSFFFKKIFKSQPIISLREAVEGHNSSIVILDWYLPKWISPQCNQCSLFIHSINTDNNCNSSHTGFNTGHSGVTTGNSTRDGNNSMRSVKDGNNSVKSNNSMKSGRLSGRNKNSNVRNVDDYFKMYTIQSMEYAENSKFVNSDTDASASSASYSSEDSIHSPSFTPSNASLTHIHNTIDRNSMDNRNTIDKSTIDTRNTIDYRNTVDKNLVERSNNVSPVISHQSSEKFDAYYSKFNEKFDTIHKPERNDEGPNPKIIRGVIVIIGDMNISYRICSTRVGCYCKDKPYEDSDELCDACNESDRLDHEGYSLEHPGFPTLRSLVSDALRSGFVCVHLHLNVNLGMACEAFPDSIPLRSFPISLYSDVLLDLNCALDKVSQRFPNAPILAVGISFGANILLEYMSVSAQGGAVKLVSDSENENSLQNTIVSNSPFVDNSLNYTNSFDSFSKPFVDIHSGDPNNSITNVNTINNSMDSGNTINNSMDNSMVYSNVYSMLKSGKGGRRVSKSVISDSNKSANTEKSVRNRKFSLFTRNSNTNTQLTYDTINQLNSQINTQMTTPMVNPMNNPMVNPMNSPMNNTINNQNEICDDHFMLNLNREEFNTDIKTVYPEEAREVYLNPERISAAVCINPNLKLSSNVLYNLSKRKGKRSMYKRYCLARFKSELTQLLASVHCHRTNNKLSKECNHFNCCHYNKVLSRLSLMKKFFYHVFTRFTRRRKKSHNYTTEKLITSLHREYRHSYRDLVKKGLDYINYGDSLFKCGVRTTADFKLSVLMTVKHRFEREGQDNKIKVRHISEPPVYKCINKSVNTNLRIGKSVFARRKLDKVHKMLDYKVTKYITNLINSDYTRNTSNIRENLELIKVPTLLLYSLDNSIFTLKDIDIFDVIKNPNIVYYVSQTGGYSTFLSGLRPSSWFIAPVLEFLEEMSTKSKTF